MKTKRTTPKPTRRARTGGSHALVPGISDMLRSLGVTLGNAYADDASADLTTKLESAKDSLLEARRLASSHE